MRKVLVIQTASIGDVVLATSLLEELHKEYFDIYILVKKENESLFEGHPFVHTLVWNKSFHKYRNLVWVVLTVFFKRFDFVFDIQRYLSTGIITVLTGSHTTGFKENPMSLFFSKRVEHGLKLKDLQPTNRVITLQQRHPLHEVERNFLLLQSMTLKEKPFKLRPKLYITEEVEAATQQYKEKTYYTISPSSLWPTKTFHKEGWIELIKHVADDRVVYLLGSEKDSALCEDILRKSERQNVVSLAGKLSYLQSASLMKDAKMNYTNDSAPTHFASAVNAPVTTVFCSTIPDFGFGPLSDDSLIVQTEERLSCRPCSLHGRKKCPKKNFPCCSTIDIQKLIDRL
jgi:ADP-heptose:LPS heptosyltransferase